MTLDETKEEKETLNVKLKSGKTVAILATSDMVEISSDAFATIFTDKGGVNIALK